MLSCHDTIVHSSLTIASILFSLSLSSWYTLLEHSHVHNRMQVCRRGCLLSHVGRTDVQLSQIRFSGSEPCVVGSSWRSFPVCWKLANRSSCYMLMVFIRNTACDVAKESQASLRYYFGKWATLTLPWLLHMLYDKCKGSPGFCGEPMYQMHLSRHTSTLLWPKFHTHSIALALCDINMYIT